MRPPTGREAEEGSERHILGHLPRQSWRCNAYRSQTAGQRPSWCSRESWALPRAHPLNRKRVHHKGAPHRSTLAPPGRRPGPVNIPLDYLAEAAVLNPGGYRRPGHSGDPALQASDRPPSGRRCRSYGAIPHLHGVTGLLRGTTGNVSRPLRLVEQSRRCLNPAGPPPRPPRGGD